MHLRSCIYVHVAPPSLCPPAAQSFMVITYTAELYMLPLVLLLVFFKNLLVLTVAGLQGAGREEEDVSTALPSPLLHTRGRLLATLSFTAALLRRLY